MVTTRSTRLKAISNRCVGRRTRLSRGSRLILTRPRIYVVLKKKINARSALTKFKMRSSLLTRRMSKLTGTGKNLKRKKIAKNLLR